MPLSRLYERYCELQSYVGWSEADEQHVRSIKSLLEPFFPELIDDFYNEIEKHPNARKVITGGQAQIERLKGTLMQWIRELVAGCYDADYVSRRWRVGWRHVEIGLDQVFTNVALSRLRIGLIRATQEAWKGDIEEQRNIVRSLNKLMDLDLAIIEDAYQTEYSLRIQRNERLATLGQVAGGVAHELRNPLNVVKTSVFYLLNARNPTPEKKAEHLKRIERHVELADGVITALSSFAKMPIPDLVPIPVAALFEEALEENPLGTGINVDLNIPESLPLLRADRAQIKIVLGNLLRNARDAMSGAGTLRISAREEAGHIDLMITDTGMGIPAENLSRIMEPLYSTKARGLGLGLAIARSILEKNHGTLRVTSEPGHGSTFTVRLMGAAGSGAPVP